jgi:hypothetical protein
MKLSALTTKLTCVQSKVVRALAAATLAGAVLTAAAPAAQAQQFSVGVQIGGPRYVAPAYGYGPSFYERQRFEEARRHEEWLRQREFDRHERFDRDHHFDNRGYRR